MSNSVKAYLGKDPYIFVSYAHKDSAQVMPFIEALQKKYNVWFDEGIHFGAEWEDEIYERLEACDLFIYMITPASLASEHCKNEIRTARDLKKNFVNILMDSNTELPGRFKFSYGGYQMFVLDTYSSLESAVDDLVRKSKAGWFESVHRADIAVEMMDESPAATDTERDSKCSDEGESKASKIDTYRREGNYIYFGEYPQTIKADNVNMTGTTDARGYYLGSDGAYYAKEVARPYKDEYKFSTGKAIQENTAYYFKVEPIKWKILNEENGVAFVLCDNIITNRRFDSGSNNYAKSEIRAWLNNEFYTSAFSALQQGIIEITEVDNSARSTNPAENAKQWNDGENQYVCKNTRDKIFLLSEEEVTTIAYGFSSYSLSNTARRKQISDYTRATGAYMNTDTDYYGNGWWWLRSPHFYYSDYARKVYGCSGHASGDCSVRRTCYGVVPALRIRLNDNITLDDKTRVEATIKCDSKCSDESESKASKIDTYRREGDYIYFGEYPQTKVTDDAIFSTLNAQAGTLPTSANAQAWTDYGYYISGSVQSYMWYKDVELNGTKYRGVYFTSYRLNNTLLFDITGNSNQDINGYTTGNVYWFRYEPIKWRILTTSNGIATILCELAIDSQEYQNTYSSAPYYNNSDGTPSGTYANNYEYSTIRAWLNDTFYNTAFNDMQKSIIQLTTVDNSVSQNYSSGKYASCNNTSDNVFLLSYKEAFGTYLNSYEARQKESTDYAKSQGCWASYIDDLTEWWLRSPYYYYSSHAWYVNDDGDGSDDSVNCDYYGVVPALKIKL